MRTRRLILIFILCIISVTFTVIYFLTGSLTNDTVFVPKPEKYADKKWVEFEGRLKQLESDLVNHHETIKDISQSLQKIVTVKSKNAPKIPEELLQNVAGQTLISTQIINNNGCSIQTGHTPKTDIQMLELYKRIKFDNVDGGVWKQGWKIEINEKNWNKEHKLKVFVVPHSHNDPGWLKTVDEYYLSATKHILNSMLIKLEDDPRRKFIWAEISYFSMWWEELDDSEKKRVKELLRKNQLEIVTGGWVMNDEANSHWLSVYYQLSEGHQWLKKNLNYIPRSHWSIDPFGLSPTQAFLLKNSGLQNMLLQRVHYSVKKELARRKELEFKWKQLWDDGSSSEIFTQVMPFYSYDIPHTCGPDPKICCQFDFKRLSIYGSVCPWKINPKPITEQNVAERASLLLDQYRKKSMLFKTNVLLVPLGDDFRYTFPTEWDNQYMNYQKLMDYINTNVNLHAQVQFGTLSDYFDAVRADKSMKEFPTLTGDFFTYSDRDDHYWSGYYTSRPFYKRMDRLLLSYVRGAEIILALSQLCQNSDSVSSKTGVNSLEEIVSESRRSLALFQHHDGITGTAKDHVVIDYGKKMLASIKGLQHVIQASVNSLLLNNYPMTTDEVVYKVDDIWRSHDKAPERYTITIGPELSTKYIVLYNSLPQARHEVISFVVSTPFLQVLNWKGARVKCQVSPIFENSYEPLISHSKYEVSFIASLPALGLVRYVIQALYEKEVPRETTYAKVKILNHYMDIPTPTGFSFVEISPTPREFSIQNSKIVASFTTFGLLKAIKIDSKTIPIHLDFARYGVRHTQERSGAYLFLPNGNAVPISLESTTVKIIEGSIFSSVQVRLPYVQHSIKLYNSTGADGLGLEIENLVDIEKTTNFELVMRLMSNIKSGEDFFTDLNGYQLIRRKRFSKLPLQANYYPMPSMMYIEDNGTRLTMISSTPLGCSSLKEGQMEVMQDRRLNQDDSRGLGQGVLDNHPTRHVFRVVLEHRKRDCYGTSDNYPSGFPTLSVHIASQSLLNPIFKLLRVEDEDLSSRPVYMPSAAEFGVDYTLPILRTDVLVGNKTYVAVTLHRQQLDLCFSDEPLLHQFPLSSGKCYRQLTNPT
ncbi:alpha-mannosidase 2 isoform X2 [Agrilus planipennis]|uniref:Alpha-mannosidase n=1 Tax=Agrilus planipennis TaxID=224129 RepID=A0A7F5RA58_AGRPL|nr:alpha-mannosidase 2 isoform X2 [Agrilus planipennis]